MNIGDRFHVAPGASSVVVVREIRVNGLVVVENETPGRGVYPYLTKPDHFVPATTEPPTPATSATAAGDDPDTAEQTPDTNQSSYLDALNNT